MVWHIYFHRNHIYAVFQSGFRPPVPSAVPPVLSAVLVKAVNDRILASAFDTIDHNILVISVHSEVCCAKFVLGPLFFPLYVTSYVLVCL